MYSLFQVRFNWQIFLIIAVFVWWVFPDLSWYSYFAIIISIQQFTLMFNAVNNVIPVRYLFGIFMCLQFFIGPMLAYNGLDQFQYDTYKMKIPEEVYFSYALPAVLSFIAGLHITAGKLKGEVIDEQGVQVFVNRYPALPFVFIGVGFISSIISIFFASELTFVFTLLAGFKFIGLFLLILGNRKLKLIPVIIVVGSIISTSLSEGMFHDLLTWLIFTASVLAIKYRPTFFVKLIFVIGFIILSVIIQQLKGGYRQITQQGGEATGVETFSKVYEEKNASNDIFSFASLAPSNVRINQGFIITNIMKTVPAKIPFSEGAELWQIIEAAFFLRILAPNKLTAGNQEIFKKYSGMPLARNTSMALSSLGDAYVNFGISGGCVFMFLLGLLYSEVLKAFARYSRYFPVLILFTALVFYYPIRPDCELQTTLGHLVKSCFLIYVVIAFWKNYFKVKIMDHYKMADA